MLRSAMKSTPPERVESLVAGHHPAGIGGKEGEQILLQPTQVNDRRPGPHLTVQDSEAID